MVSVSIWTMRVYRPVELAAQSLEAKSTLTKLWVASMYSVSWSNYSTVFRVLKLLGCSKLSFLIGKVTTNWKNASLFWILIEGFRTTETDGFESKLSLGFSV